MKNYPEDELSRAKNLRQNHSGTLTLCEEVQCRYHCTLCVCVWVCVNMATCKSSIQRSHRSTSLIRMSLGLLFFLFVTSVNIIRSPLSVAGTTPENNNTGPLLSNRSRPSDWNVAPESTTSVCGVMDVFVSALQQDVTAPL